MSSWSNENLVCSSKFLYCLFITCNIGICMLPQFNHSETQSCKQSSLHTMLSRSSCTTGATSICWSEILGMFLFYLSFRFALIVAGLLFSVAFLNTSCQFIQGSVTTFLKSCTGSSHDYHKYLISMIYISSHHCTAQSPVEFITNITSGSTRSQYNGIPLTFLPHHFIDATDNLLYTVCTFK